MKKISKIIGILLTLVIVSGIIYGIKCIPDIGHHASNNKKENQEITLHVYELDYGETAYLITSAEYSMDCSYSNVILTFYSKSIYDDIGNIWFSVRDKPAKVKIIKSFVSKKDTISFIRIK